MSIRSTVPIVAGLSASVLLAGCVTALATQAPQPAVEIQNAGPVVVWTAYLRAGEDRAVARGMVRRAQLWRGPVSGHLHITAFGATGEVLARRAPRWAGILGGSHSVPFQADLGVPRAAVAKLQVAYAAGVHKASEGFK